jgi:hypothetical protein
MIQGKLKVLTQQWTAVGARFRFRAHKDSL